MLRLLHKEMARTAEVGCPHFWGFNMVCCSAGFAVAKVGTMQTWVSYLIKILSYKVMTFLQRKLGGNFLI